MHFRAIYNVVWLKMKFYTVIKIINEYAKSTTIHGINYIFQSGIPIIERLLWIVVMMIMVFFASLLSRSAYIEWEDHPVVTTVKSTGKSIKDVFLLIWNKHIVDKLNSKFLCRETLLSWKNNVHFMKLAENLISFK